MLPNDRPASRIEVCEVCLRTNSANSPTGATASAEGVRVRSPPPRKRLPNQRPASHSRVPAEAGYRPSPQMETTTAATSRLNRKPKESSTGIPQTPTTSTERETGRRASRCLEAR